MFVQGTVKSINESAGYGAVQFGPNQVLFYLRDGRTMSCDTLDGPDFTDQKLSRTPTIGDQLVCFWPQHGTVRKWTFLEEYDRAEDADDREVDMWQYLQDVFVEDVILRRAREKHPDSKLPIKGRREDLDRFHHHAIELTSWALMRGMSDQARNKLLEEMALHHFEGKPDGDLFE